MWKATEQTCFIYIFLPVFWCWIQYVIRVSCWRKIRLCFTIVSTVYEKTKTTFIQMCYSFSSCGPSYTFVMPIYCILLFFYSQGIVLSMYYLASTICDQKCEMSVKRTEVFSWKDYVWVQGVEARRLWELRCIKWVKYSLCNEPC